jgi:frataxin-like iron-binding protein CyaY
VKLTQELIDQIQEAMLHTKKDGSINWKDGDEVVVQLAGTFANDRFIVIKNKTKDPVVSAQPHPHFDYEKKEWIKDGREEYMKELEALDKQYMKEQNEPRSTDG